MAVISGITAIHDKYFLPDEAGYLEADWYDMDDGLFDTAHVGGPVSVCIYVLR